MNPLILVAPAAEATRRPTGDPPGDPPGDFAPVLAHAAQAPAGKSRNDGARTATAEGAETEAAHTEVPADGEADTTPATAKAAATEPAPAATATAAAPEAAPAAAQAPAAPAADTTTDTTSGTGSEQVAHTPSLEVAPAPEQDDTVVAPPVKAPPGLHWDATAAQPVAAEAAPAQPVPAAAASQTAVATAPVAETAASQTPAQPAINALGVAPAVESSAPQAVTAAPVAANTAPETAAAPATAQGTPQESGDLGRQEQPASRQPARDLTAAVTQTQAAATAEPQAATTAPTAKPDGAVDPQKPAQPVAAAPVARAETTAAAPVQTPDPAQAVSAPSGQGFAVDRPVAETPRAHSNLAQLAHTARTVVRMAVRDGATQAHITLHPAELGQVEIRLRYHAGGVSADVLADSPAAAQALQQAAGELKRSLEAQGLVVHNLDVRQGEQERRTNEHHGQGSPSRRHDREYANDHSDHTTIDTSSLPLAAGAIDVLA